MLDLMLTLLAVIIVIAIAYYVLSLVGLEEKYKVGLILIALLFVVIYLLGGRLF